MLTCFLQLWYLVCLFVHVSYGCRCGCAVTRGRKTKQPNTSLYRSLFFSFAKRGERLKRSLERVKHLKSHEFYITTAKNVMYDHRIEGEKKSTFVFFPLPPPLPTPALSFAYLHIFEKHGSNHNLSRQIYVEEINTQSSIHLGFMFLRPVARTLRLQNKLNKGRKEDNGREREGERERKRKEARTGGDGIPLYSRPLLLT